MYSFDYSDYPQQETNFLPNSSPFHFGHDRINPFFHHQNYLPHQMGIFLPQTLDQDPNPTITLPNIDNQEYHSPNFPFNPSAPYEIFTYNQAPLGFPSSPRKDRHTKISTAHGFRDRRVRLSMAIAREFFDLQDMLGFDKASKTIEWLLAKSKSAIQELALGKQNSDLSRSSSDYSSRPSTRKRSCKSSASASHSKEEIIEKNSVENQANFVVARKNRAEARARARERTREKLSGRAKTVIQNDDLGFQTSATTVSSSQFVVEKEGCNAPTQNLNGLNVIRSPHSSPSPLISCSDYLENLTRSDQGDSNNLASLLLGSEYNSEAGAICSSFFGLEHLYFSNRNAHDPSNPWEELSNNVCAPIER